MPDCKETKMAKMLLLQSTLNLSHQVMLPSLMSTARQQKLSKSCRNARGHVHLRKGHSTPPKGQKRFLR